VPGSGTPRIARQAGLTHALDGNAAPAIAKPTPEPWLLLLRAR